MEQGGEETGLVGSRGSGGHRQEEPRLPWWLTVKNLPAMQETQVRSLGQEDPLEKGMTTHSSILAWRIPWTEKPGGLQASGSQSRTRLSN